MTIGYLGTGYLVLTLTICYYLIEFDPRASPFRKLHQSKGNDNEPETNDVRWRPNPIDSLFLEWVRGVGRALRALLPRLGRYEWYGKSLDRAFTKVNWYLD